MLSRTELQELIEGKRPASMRGQTLGQALQRLANELLAARNRLEVTGYCVVNLCSARAEVVAFDGEKQLHVCRDHAYEAAVRSNPERVGYCPNCECVFPVQ